MCNSTIFTYKLLIDVYKQAGGGANAMLYM